MTPNHNVLGKRAGMGGLRGWFKKKGTIGVPEVRGSGPQKMLDIQGKGFQILPGHGHPSRAWAFSFARLLRRVLCGAMLRCGLRAACGYSAVSTKVPAYLTPYSSTYSVRSLRATHRSRERGPCYTDKTGGAMRDDPERLNSARVWKVAQLYGGPDSVLVAL